MVGLLKRMGALEEKWLDVEGKIMSGWRERGNDDVEIWNKGAVEGGLRVK